MAGRIAPLVLGAAALALVATGCGTEQRPSASREPSPAHLRVGAAGDFGIKPSGVATLESMAEAKPDIYLGLGDFSYAGPGSESAYCRLVHSKLGAGAPFEIVSGNHEEDSGEDGLIDNFAACLPDREGSTGEYAKQYYFDVGGLARFIMISPDLTIDHRYFYYGPNGGGETPELAWLKEAVAGARADGIRWVIVGMHKPCITEGVYYCDVYQALFSTLIRSGVDLVLSGHDHTYQRSKQIAAPRPGCPRVLVDHFNPRCVANGGRTQRKGAGTVFVVAGSGGAPLYPVHAGDPEAGYFATAMGANSPGRRHGFALLQISPSRLAVRFVPSTPGTFSDRFRIVAGGR
jgi:hypothetical protein